MLESPVFWLLYAAISLVSCLVTAYDKLASKYFPRNRIREATLFLFAAIGGSLAMYLTMLLIRHKTKHRSFMVGLPLMLAVQIVLLSLAAWA